MVVCIHRSFFIFFNDLNVFFLSKAITSFSFSFSFRVNSLLFWDGAYSKQKLQLLFNRNETFSAQITLLHLLFV